MSGVEPGNVVVTALRSPNRKLKPAEVDQVVERYQAGETLVELARSFGVHEQTIKRKLAARGVSRRPVQLLDDESKARVLALRQEGLTYPEIAERLGVTVGVVGRVVRATRQTHVRPGR